MTSLNELQHIRDQYSCLCDDTASYEKFLIPTRGSGMYAWCMGDDEPYIDLVMGYSSLNFGHNNPEIVTAAKNALDKLIHIHSFNTEGKLLLSKLLVEELDTNERYGVYFDVSGSNVVSVAVRIARHYTRKRKVVSFTGGFHGATNVISAGLTDDDILNKDQYLFNEFEKDVIRIEYPDRRIAGSSITAINKLSKIAREHDIAAVVIEPVLGAGGFIFPEEDFLLQLRELTKSNSVLLISDEIQVGMGRLGYLYASKRYGIVPDIILLAKSLAGGIYPLSAFICRSELYKVVPSKGSAFHTTFNNSPFGTRVAYEVLKIAKSKGWFDNALVTGPYLLKELEFLDQSEFISGLRGDGMALAFDIVKPASYTAITEHELPNIFVNICLERKLIVALSGKRSNTIKITPPINLTLSECDIIISRLKECFMEFSNRLLKK